MVVSPILSIYSTLHWIRGEIATRMCGILLDLDGVVSVSIRSSYESDLLRRIAMPRMEPAAVLAAAASSAP